MNRHEAREQAFFCIFQQGINQTPFDVLLQELRSDNMWCQQIEDLIRCFEKNSAVVDESIRANLQGWEFERITHVDKSALRTAIAELMLGDTPTAVIINEAVDFAKRYGVIENGKFVHGVLGRVSKKIPQPSVTV